MRVLLLALLGLVLVTSLAVPMLLSQGQERRVYTLAAVRTGLERDPRAWLRRALRVRGVAVPCGDTLAAPNMHCMYGLPVLRAEAGASGGMLLRRGQPDQVYAPLRNIPLLRDLLPAPAAFHWGVPATYMVEIVALPNAIPGTPDDYEALLLDTAP
jgi:hypothetical protein